MICPSARSSPPARLVKDYYTRLGIPRDASADEIKRAYRTLARRYHPDHNQEPGAEEKFKELTEAYAVLSNPNRRAQYDREGILLDPKELANEVRQAFWEFVGDIFPGMKRKAKERSGQDVRSTIPLSLEEAIFGTTREIQVPRWRPCAACGGRGGEHAIPPRSCPACEGRGEIKGRGIFGTTRECEQCRGRGIAFVKRCHECHGRGEALRDTPITLTFPAGVQDGQSIWIRGAGLPGEGGGKDGDLTVEVKYDPHRLFVPQGRDLYLEVHVRLDEAAEGGRVNVPTPDGEVTIKLPPETQSGKLLKIQGRGLRTAKGERGDLLVRIVVETPRLSDEKLAVLRALLDETPHDRRATYLDALRSYHPRPPELSRPEDKAHG